MSISLSKFSKTAKSLNLDRDTAENALVKGLWQVAAVR
jgi:hypothetical protein